MSFFDKASHVYSPDEIDLLRGSVERAKSLLQNAKVHYNEDELTATVISLYDSGLRDLDHLVELAIQMVRSPTNIKKSDDYGIAANVNHKTGPLR